MGRQVLPVDWVPAGNVVDIASLDQCVLKLATLSCSAFRSMSFLATPIIRVTMERVHPSEMPALNMVDPCVEVMVQGTGEHVARDGGGGPSAEVHGRPRQAVRPGGGEVIALEPIVPFRETVVTDETNRVVPSSPGEVDGEEEGREGTLSVGSFLGREGRSDCVSLPEGWVQTANRAHTLLVRAIPLPGEVSRLLEANVHLLKALSAFSGSSMRETREEDDVATVKLNDETLEQLCELREKLRVAFEGTPEQASGATDRIWSFGPRGSVLNCVPTYQRPSMWSSIDRCVVKGVVTREHDTSIVNGFQLATLSGPLCEEPMHGVCMVLQQWSHQVAPPSQMGPPLTSSEDTPSLPFDAYGPISGQLVSAMKEGCRRAFLAQLVRLMAATYSCSVLATAEVLGKLYGVLGRSGGKVCSEEVKEGTVLFNVRATLPVAESFGFAKEMRKKTSGLASPQLVFSHWEVIPSDPFWVPTTEEELLHFGEKADTENIARGYMNMVRKRKGLPVDEKLVEHGEKQRTLIKNK
eukprot:Em0009g1036a